MTQAVGSSAEHTHCWCVNVSFSAELLARVPAQAERKACICQACATRPAMPHE
jgi:hypothetical protein